MNTRLRSLLIVVGLASMSGCVAYTPYSRYSDDDYGYAAPVVPLPVPMYQGWGYQRHHHYHHHHHHDDD